MLERLLKALLLWFSGSYQKGKESGRELPSPKPRVPGFNISYDNRQLIIDNLAPPIWITTVLDTNSMDPLIDIGHTVILSKAFDLDDLIVGDIVVYNCAGQDILHRIAEIGTDEKGRYFRLKGDNNSRLDIYVVRDEHIKWLLKIIIY